MPLSLEGPNRKFICCPIDQSYLLVGIVDAEEYEGRVVFELSSAAAEMPVIFQYWCDDKPLILVINGPNLNLLSTRA